MRPLPGYLILIAIFSIAAQTIAQNVETTQLIGTWKLVEDDHFTASREVKHVPEIALNSSRKNVTSTTSTDKFLKIDKRYVTFYFYDFGQQGRYRVTENILDIQGEGIFKIVKVSKNELILEKDKKLSFVKMKEPDFSRYELKGD
ncbi:hypothetical protein [Cochleicola gelatinilyticus]|uniref:Lipocalin-like domain-containing protein n=1 Tax=Cochleicola gelatinilyticus TaxID=1763537 RepID=A0A167IRX5_9FLAO|nr:hypothetical protein [Cochleicola gelatinilyticus]OAB79956.1 hypothetical protein ULVI_04245 [Cochleicola gelatinilyticus]